MEKRSKATDQGKKTLAKNPTSSQATSDPTPAILCQTCKKEIKGESMKAFGKFWHPQHFTCVKCKNPIVGQFNMKDDQLYCKADYAEMFLARCPKCDKPVTDQAILAIDKTWHPEHFLCAKCGVKLAQSDNDPFCVNDGQPYCRKDYLELFGVRCFGCKEPIVGTGLVAMEEKWHPQCLKCSKCNEPLTEAFMLVEGRPVCQKCAK